jgi:hypothetical protein
MGHRFRNQLLRKTKRETVGIEATISLQLRVADGKALP